MSIRESGAEIKAKTSGWITSGVGKDLVLIGLIILVGSAGFGLGRLSGAETAPGGLQIGQVASVVVSDGSVPEVEPMAAGGRLVGSRNSDKYHFPWCSGAQRISPGNLVWFESAAAARAAGYTPAGNCKGLE